MNEPKLREVLGEFCGGPLMETEDQDIDRLLSMLDTAGYKIVPKSDVEQMLERIKHR